MKDERKLKILVVHEISYVEKVIYEIHEFPELLAEAGHDVHFLEFSEGYSGSPGQNPRRWKQQGRVYKNAELTLHSPWLSGVFAIDRLVALLSVFAVLWRLRREKFDVILNFAVPTYGLQVLLFGWLTGTSVVHRALDVSHKIRKSLWNPFISVVEWIVFNLASLRSANNPAMADYIKSRLMDRAKKIVVHYPPSLSPGMEPVPYDSQLALSLGINPQHKVIAYLGGFFYFSGLDQVVKDFSAAMEANPNFRLLLIGGGEQDEELRTLAKQSSHPERIIFTGFIPFEEIPRYFSFVDVAINPMEVSEVSNYALPNKVLQYLALRVPTVATKLLGLKSAIEDCEGISWTQSPKDVFEECRRIAMIGKASASSATRSDCLSQFAPKVATEMLVGDLKNLSHG